MNKIELRNKLSAKFDFQIWKEIFERIFSTSNVEYLSQEVSIDAALIKNGGQVGTIRLDDGRSLAIFKFEVADNIVIARNRRGLRDIAAKYVDQSLIHGALVLYYSDNQTDYRLTFVAKQSTFDESGQLIKTETAPKRYTFLLGPNEPCTTAANRLYELLECKRKNGSIYLADVTEAFSVERLNKEFFDGYRKQYFNFLAPLSDTKQNRDYVKKLLGRIVFLHFLQKKGWMGVPASHSDWSGGDKNYLAHLVDRHNGNDRLLSDVLEPLFFKTLNEPRPDDSADSILGENIKIPYLNGGLFDKDDIDKLDIDFPYDYFKNLMDFFSQYNFTIDENDPDDNEVGIDPEMLGHIFENLLEDNKDKGAFYTPKEIVQYMCRESVIQYLKTHEPDARYAEAIEHLIRNGEVDKELQDKAIAMQFTKWLSEVKVCDPAIGSGAFPMGVLNVLYHSRRLLYGFTKENTAFSPAEVKREIIQNNIYGVDIEQGAVDIARLRFWLSLVVDEDRPQPLPNLDYKIMQGNSLLESFMGIDLSKLTYKEENKKDKDEMSLFDDEKNRLQKSVSQLLSSYYSCSDHDKKVKLQQEISNAINKQIESYDIAILCEFKKLNLAENNKFFLWHTWFNDVFNRDDKNGFDIIIGNPPYLRIQGIRASTPLLAEALVKQYKAATGSFDLYAVFVERALQIINKNGIVNYIMPVKWTNAAFGKGLRTVVAESNAAHKIINFGAYQVFNASTYTGLQWFKFGSSKLLYYELDKNLSTNKELGNYLSNLSDTEAYSVQSEKLGHMPWVLTVGSTARILNLLEKQPRRIKDIFDKIFQGIATSKDDVYFLYDCQNKGNCVIGESKQLGRIITIERGLVRPLLKGEDVHRYDHISTNRYVIFPYKIIAGKAILFTERELSDLYPLGYAYLKECEDILRAREHGRFNIDGKWFQYGRKQGIMFGEIEKLVAPDISMGSNFAYDSNGEFYSTTTIYGYVKRNTIKESYKFWLALLNSRLCWWFMSSTGTPLANGFFRYKPDYINPFPVPDNISIETEKAITTLVDYIIVIKSISEDKIIWDYTNNDVLIRQFEKIIDALIYEMYFPEEFQAANISFAEHVNSDFKSINNGCSISQAIQTIIASFEQLRSMDNEIRNNLKYMSIKLEYLLAPIINA